jgi:hypothetical protein
VPEKNFWATAILSIINKYIQSAPPIPGAPGLFRCAEKGFLADLFKKAGLKNISEREVSGKLNAGSRETYWNFMTEVVAPVVAALSNAGNAVKEKIRGEVFESILQKYPDGKVAINSNALLIYGEKLRLI